MATCLAGHESTAADYCDVCGIRIGSPAAATAGSSSGGGASGDKGGRPDVGVAPPGPGSLCPRCGTAGLVRFCEACGYQVGADPAPVTAASSGPAPGSASPPGPDPAS